MQIPYRRHYSWPDEDVIELGEEPIRKDTMAATQQSSAKPRTPGPRAQDSPT